MSKANKDSVHHDALAAESPEAGRSSTAAHTRGPWRVFTAPGGHKIIGIGELTGEGVADCGFGVWRGGSAEALANARLIAAAPTMADEIVRLKALNAEMLAALRGAMVLIDTMSWPEHLSTEGNAVLTKRRTAVLAAIARAGDA